MTELVMKVENQQGRGWDYQLFCRECHMYDYGCVLNIWSYWLSESKFVPLKARFADLEELRDREVLQ